MLWSQKWQSTFIFIGAAPVGGTPKEDSAQEENSSPPGKNEERLVWKEVEKVVHGGACEAEIIVVRSAEV